MNTQTQQRPLVERLREGCIINPKRWSGDPGEPSPVNESATEELLMEAADEIERLRAIEAQATGLKREVERLRADRQRWIPVTERLPKAYVPVLGFRPLDDFLIVYLGDDDSSFQDNADYNTVVGVTHWMPLPPPPVQESQA